jgi:hypothetical protein
MGPGFFLGDGAGEFADDVAKAVSPARVVCGG